MEKEDIKKTLQKKWIYSSFISAIATIISLIASIFSFSTDMFINQKLINNIYFYIFFSFIVLIMFANYTIRRFNLSPSKDSKIKDEIAECYIKALNESKFNPSKN